MSIVSQQRHALMENVSLCLKTWQLVCEMIIYLYLKLFYFILTHLHICISQGRYFMHKINEKLVIFNS